MTNNSQPTYDQARITAAKNYHKNCDEKLHELRRVAQVERVKVNVRTTKPK